MKKLLAILLALCLAMSGLAAFAEEAEKTNEEAFKEGLLALLGSIDMEDMITTVTQYMGQDVARVVYKTDGTVFDGAIESSQLPGGLQIQVSQEEIYAAVSGQALHLKFADLQDITMAVYQAMMQYAQANMPPELMAALQKIDPESLEAMGPLLVKHLLVGLKSEQTEDGLVITYEATVKDLLNAFCNFVDEILQDEKYTETASNLVVAALIASQQSAEGIPTAQELVENWPMLKQQIAAVEIDADIALKVFIANDFSKIDVEGSAGVPGDLYLMSWHYAMDGEKGQITLDGKLTERIQRSAEDTPRDYDIDIHFDASLSGSMMEYNLTIDYPYRGFAAEVRGMGMGGMGKVDASVTIRGRKMWQLSANYALSMDGISLDGKVMTTRGTWGMSLLVNKKHASLKATEMNKEVLALDVWLDDQMNVTSASLITPDMTAEYDGEKLVIVSNGVTVTCTAEFESANAFVVTMHAEGETVAEGQDNAYIRVEYQGEKGNWSLSGTVIDPTGAEVLKSAFTVSPTEPIVPIAETYADRLMEITPEFVTMMLNSYLNQLPALLGE